MRKKTTRKKTTRKKASRKSGATDIKPLAVTKTENVEFMASPRYGTKYQPIFDAMANLKKGEAVIVPVEKGDTTRQVHNRLSTALRRQDITPPKGCRFRKRTTADGNVAVYCEAA